jgi:hypothetical protein
MSPGRRRLSSNGEAVVKLPELKIEAHRGVGVSRREVSTLSVSLATALCLLDLSVYQFDDRHRGGVTRAVAKAKNPCVTTLSFGQPWGDLIE